MNTTTTRPLPTDLGTLLRHWLPPEPTDTTVSRQRHAITLIANARQVMQAELAALDADERETVTALADAAYNGDAPDHLLDHVKPAKRTAITYRLALLEQARRLATDRLAAAERTDPEHTAWLAECERITEAWQQANSGEPEQRFERLVTFAEVHRPR